MTQLEQTTITAAVYTALTQGAALLAQPRAGVIQLTDADRADFLHRMTSNDINALRPDQSAVTVLTSPTARILYVFTVVCRADDLLLLPAADQTAGLARHLRGQIFFMDKVKVQDVSDQWARLRLAGPRAAQAAVALGIDTVGLEGNAWTASGDVLAVAQPDYGVPGYELLVPAEQAQAVTAALTAAGGQPVDQAAYDVRRIELGRPAPGAELVEEYNPLEAGLAWACAENKGCYTGQEIIARQITYDKVTKTLVGLTGPLPFRPGAEVTVDGRAAGVVTSAALSPALGPLALAVIKRPHNTPGVAVTTDGQTATVAALPFAAR
jgi:folate-binding protein YgfZ